MSDYIFNEDPKYRQNLSNYENQSFYYSHPKCTFCKFPPIINEHPGQIQQNVYYINQPKSTSNYFPYPDAYPSFPYMPAQPPSFS